MEDLSKLSKQELIDRLSRSGTFNNDTEVEMNKIERLASANNPNAIPVVTKNDHRNLFLYTVRNKRVGPLHPDNAKRVMQDWKRKGVQLYTEKRTEQQVQDWLNSPEGKADTEAHEKLRALRQSGSKKNDMERFAKEIASATAAAVATATAK